MAKKSKGISAPSCDKDYQIDNDARTIESFGEVKSNPSRMAAAMGRIGKRMSF